MKHGVAQVPKIDQSSLHSWRLAVKKPPAPRPNYGIDAPGVVRNLFVAGSIALLMCLVCLVLPRTEWTRSLTQNGAVIAVACLGMGGYMFYSSKFGKLREREWLLDLI